MITHFFPVILATKRNTITLKCPQEDFISHLQPGLEMQSNKFSAQNSISKSSSKNKPDSDGNWSCQEIPHSFTNGQKITKVTSPSYACFSYKCTQTQKKCLWDLLQTAIINQQNPQALPATQRLINNCWSRSLTGSVLCTRKNNAEHILHWLAGMLCHIC